MVARFEANYPFLNAAREFAAANGIELEPNFDDHG